MLACRLLESKHKLVIDLCFSLPCKQTALAATGSAMLKPLLSPFSMQVLDSWTGICICFIMQVPCLTTWTRRLLESKRKPVIGLCFSLPCKQTALAAGRILHLTKRFENPGAVGMDPVAEMSAALDRAGLPVSILLASNGS